jgi:hypothetical protein
VRSLPADCAIGQHSFWTEDHVLKENGQAERRTL